MPRTPVQYEEIRNEKRNLILNTALDLFANKGYASTSISQIAEKANISKGLIYNYFESKDEVLKIIMTSFIDSLAELVDPNQDNKIDEQEALQFFDFIFDIFKKRREELKLFYQLSLQSEVRSLLKEKSIQKKIEKYTGMYTDFFEKKYSENAYFVMMNLHCTIKGLSFQYAFYPENFTDDMINQYKEYLKNTFIRNK